LIKKLFGKKDGSSEQQYTIDDLIVLERYADAEQRIQEELRFRSNDLNLHLKLADVYVGLRHIGKAIDEYGFVADKYAADGFHDRAIAVLSKARRLNPMEDSLAIKMEKFETQRKLEHSRTLALEGFTQGLHAKEGGGTAVMEFQNVWRSLSKGRILRELSAEQLKLLFQGVTVVYFNPGQTVIERGSRDEVLFVVCIGDVAAIHTDGKGDTTELRVFASSNVIGEGALFEHQPWPATFKAKSKATLLRLTPHGLQICLTGNPDPRGFLDLMRREQNDREMATVVARLEASP